MFKKQMVTYEDMIKEAERIGHAIIDAAVTDVKGFARVIPEALSHGIAGALIAAQVHHGLDALSVLEKAMKMVREDLRGPDVEAN